MSTRYDVGVTQSQSSEFRVQSSEFRVQSSEFPITRVGDDEVAAAAASGWEVVILDAHHLAIMTDPGQVAAVLTGLGA